jgi:hypothetical protein
MTPNHTHVTSRQNTRSHSTPSLDSLALIAEREHRHGTADASGRLSRHRRATDMSRGRGCRPARRGAQAACAAVRPLPAPIPPGGVYV